MSQTYHRDAMETMLTADVLDDDSDLSVVNRLQRRREEEIAHRPHLRVIGRPAHPAGYFIFRPMHERTVGGSRRGTFS